MRNKWAVMVTVSVTLVLVGCGGGGGGGGGGSANSFRIGGSLAGLETSENLVLQNNGQDDLTLDASYNSQPFVFATKVDGAYAVTVRAAPAGKTCTVSAGAGTASADVSSVAVTCVAKAQSFAIGGSVTGLAAGESVVLQNNGADDTLVQGQGGGDAAVPFAFGTKVAQNAQWQVSAKSPTGSSKSCTLANASGMASADVGNVLVNCSNSKYTVGGSVVGLGLLAGDLVLSNNGEDMTVKQNGAFSFGTAVAAGADYNVQVKSSPALYTCSASNNSGKATSTISNVQVTCDVLSTYSVGGRVSGLGSGKSVALQNNAGDDLPLSNNGTFAFASKLPSGAAYAVKVKTQPAGQICSVSLGSGTVNAANVAAVTVQCSTTNFTVGGLVSGLGAGKSVGLQNAGGPELTLVANNAFTFNTPMAQGASYDVKVLTQPAAQTCTVTNGSGSNLNANVSNITVACVDAPVSDLCLNSPKACISANNAVTPENQQQVTVRWVGQTTEAANGDINPRTATFNLMGANTTGGIATAFSYSTDSVVGGSIRNITPIGGHPGFGFVVSHPSYSYPKVAGCDPGNGDNDSPVFQPKGSSQWVLNGQNHRVLQFQFTYPRSGSNGKCYDVPVTVEWMFVTGWDHPLYLVTWDTGNAQARDGSGKAAAGVIEADSRAPYGSMAWGGGGHAERSVRVRRLAWFDTRYFEASDPAGISMNTSWSWNGTSAPGTTVSQPFVAVTYNDVDAEYGLAAVQALKDKEAGGVMPAWTDRNNTNNTPNKNCPDNNGAQITLLCENQWPYQTINYTSGWDNITEKWRPAGWADYKYFSPQLGWGTVNNLMGGVNVASTRADGSRVSGYPRLSYGTFVYLGKTLLGGNSSAVGSLSQELYLRAKANVNVTTGTLAAQCLAGAGRSDTEPCGTGQNGSNNGYGAARASYFLAAQANKFAFTLSSLGVGGIAGIKPAAFFSPTFAISNYSAVVPTTLTLTDGAGKSTVLRLGRHYSASLDNQTLWLTVHYKKIINGNVLPDVVNDEWKWSLAN